jgi:hypothetical protein
MNRTEYPYKNDFKTDNCLIDTCKVGNLVNSNNDVINLPNTNGTIATRNQILQSVFCIANTKIIYCSYSFLGNIRYQNGTAITNINQVGTGHISITIADGFFTEKPILVCNIGASSLPSLVASFGYNYISSSTTNIIIYTSLDTSPTTVDIDFCIIGQS